MFFLDYFYYNLYNKSMINADNLIFLSPISIRLPSELYNLIEVDARLFGFKKNGKANISGFLNELLPNIIEVLLSPPPSVFPTNNNENFASLTAYSTFYLDTYFKPLLKGDNVTISFRVNKSHEKDFQNIYENVLPICNMDFSALLRYLLTFYAINRLSIRERFLAFKNYTEISNAIIEQKQCLVFLKKERFQLSCATIFVSPLSDRNVLLGIDAETGTVLAIPFLLITSAVIQDEEGIALKSKLKILKTVFTQYLKGEKQPQAQ